MADEVMSAAVPIPPTAKQILDKWEELWGDPEEMHKELAALERRQYALRDAINQLVRVLKNPKARGINERLEGVIQTLIHWEE
ncbi:hypothetical protein IIA79_08690 [bacterium]|nr:hypothetical protein [bacterium]